MLKKTTKSNSAVLEVEPPIPAPVRQTPVAPSPVAAPVAVNGVVYCPMCTHSVPARVEPARRGYRVLANQSCPRCSATLDAAIVIRADRN